MGKVILRHTPGSDVGAPKAGSNIWFDFLVKDSFIEICCGILWGAIFVLPNLSQTSSLILGYRICVWRYFAKYFRGRF